MNYRGIGWRAAVLRQRAGLKQVEAAALADITLKTWRNLEAGKPCRFSTIAAIADAFQTSCLWIAYGTEDQGKVLQIMEEERA